jgi:hypothetical protein
LPGVPSASGRLVVGQLAEKTATIPATVRPTTMSNIVVSTGARGDHFPAVRSGLSAI